MSALISGLDLGQAADFTALAIVEMSDGADPVFQVRHLQRFPLGTSYVAIVKRLAEMFAGPPLNGTTLAVDQTGVGRGIVDMLRHHPGATWRLDPILITAGHQVTEPERGSHGVPKKDLVGALQVLLQSGRLKIADSLPEAGVLVKELMNFKVKITVAANETYEAWREGDKDDLVLALAMAVWIGQNAYIGDWKLPGKRGMRAPVPQNVIR